MDNNINLLVEYIPYINKNNDTQIKYYNTILDEIHAKIIYINNKLDKYAINNPISNKTKEECGILDIFFW